MARARLRAQARSERRGRTIAARAAFAATAAMGVGGALAPGASAAAIQVTTNTPTGAGSLSAAVTAANGTPAQDTITFAPSVVGSIALNGQLNVTRPLDIQGPGALTLRVRQTAATSILLANAQLDVAGLTLSGGNDNAEAGGAINALENTTVRDCVLSGNTSFAGGAIASVFGNDITITDSVLTGNVAGAEGGAVLARAGATVTIRGSTLSNNKAGDIGGAIDADASIVNIEDGSKITGNSAGSASYMVNDGGGILLGSSANTTAGLTISDSQVTGNSALDAGGGIEVQFANNDVEIQRSTISGNTANGNGGGLDFGYGEGLDIASSTFSGNRSATRGGGMFVYAPKRPFTLENSTVAGNTAGVGGGIDSVNYYDVPVGFSNSTIAANTATTSGGGVYRFGFDATGPGFEGPDRISLTSTIVAGNSAPAGPDLSQGPTASGGFDVGFSLLGDDTGASGITEVAASPNKLNVPADLGPLADNGGPTQTMLPKPSSPALDAGIGDGLTFDQRGLSRTALQPVVPPNTGSDGTDIGAVELADSSVGGVSIEAAKKQKQKGRHIQIDVTVGAAEAATANAQGTIQVKKKKYALAPVRKAIAAGHSVKLTLEPKKKTAAKKIAKGLKRHRKEKATLSVTLTDASGNRVTETPKVKLK